MSWRKNNIGDRRKSCEVFAHTKQGKHFIQDLFNLLASCVSIHSLPLLLGHTFEQWYLEQHAAMAAHWKVPLSIESHLFNWLDDLDCSLPLPATELLLSSFSLSFSFPQVSYLSPVLLAFCLQPPVHSSEKWLMGVHWVQCVCVRAEPVHAHVAVSVCLTVSVCVCPSVCTAMSLGCVIEMEMSQSATAVVCHLTLHSLHCSSSSKLTLSVCDSVFACLYPCVSVCSCWQYLALQFRFSGPEEAVWKCNQLVIKIISLTFTQSHMHPHSVSSWFPWLCVVTYSSLGQLWHNKDM